MVVTHFEAACFFPFGAGSKKRNLDKPSHRPPRQKKPNWPPTEKNIAGHYSFRAVFAH
jgi:hypothetical protein